MTAHQDAPANAVRAAWIYMTIEQYADHRQVSRCTVFRWITLGLVFLDEDRFRQRPATFMGLAVFFILFVMASIGLPGMNGFVSEFLTILGAFTSEYLGVTYGVIAALGIILGAVYMLHLAAKVI